MMWRHRSFGKDSTVFTDSCNLLPAAFQTKQQCERMNRNAGDEFPADNHLEEENGDDMEI
ncbi:MAG: hypothetical protein LBQ15_03210 [Clostridium sp.]|jgi:hypothetical protein|nr:hypothetical protein [Clostridium sp.]